MWSEAALMVLLLLALLQAALLLHLWHRLQQVQFALAKMGSAAVHACTDIPTSMLVTALGRLEQRIGQLEQKQPQARLSYELAQQLAGEGAGIEQLVARCGLSRDEARLVLQLHTGSQ
ncbi:MAG: DUF2802 domain-containing protein [Rhodanobacter sp.]|nr:MAG: DUF2802 domain-containing protein [Rhodanobacter sp.]